MSVLIYQIVKTETWNFNYEKTLEEQKDRFRQIVEQNMITDGMELGPLASNPFKSKEDNDTPLGYYKDDTENNPHHKLGIALSKVERYEKNIKRLYECLNEHSDIFITKSRIMKKTLQEEKQRILQIMEQAWEENPDMDDATANAVYDAKHENDDRSEDMNQHYKLEDFFIMPQNLNISDQVDFLDYAIRKIKKLLNNALTQQENEWFKGKEYADQNPQKFQ